MAELPEDCPVKTILKQTEMIISLLDKIIDHCEKCLEEKSKDIK